MGDSSGSNAHRFGVVIVLAAAAGVACAAPGIALGLEPQWAFPLQTLSETAGTTPQVAANASNEVVAVWASSPATGDPAVQAATSSGGGRLWTAEGTISPAGAKATDPVAVVDSGGVITVAWVKGPPGAQAIQAVRSTASGWASPVDLSDATGGHDARYPQLAVDSSGVVTAVWYRNDGVANRVQAARFVNGSWTPAVDVVATGGDSERPQVAVAPSGVPTVVWQQVDGTTVLVKASRLVNGSWSAPSVLSTQAPGVVAQMPQIAIDGAGVATATWQEADNGAPSVVHASRGQDGLWAPGTALSAPGQSAVTPRVAVNAAGDAVVAWSRYDGSSTRAQAAWWESGAWGAPTTVSGGGDSAAGVAVALDGAGAATIAWRTLSAGGDADRVWAVRSSRRSWGSPKELTWRQSGQAYGPALTTGGDGITTAVWSLNRGGGSGVVEANWFGARADPQFANPAVVAYTYNPARPPNPGRPRFVRLPAATLELSKLGGPTGTAPTNGGSLTVGVTCPSATALERPAGTSLTCSVLGEITSTNFVTSGPGLLFSCGCTGEPPWVTRQKRGLQAANSRRRPQAVLARLPRVVLRPGQATRVRAPVRRDMAWGIWARGVQAFPATVRLRVVTGGTTYRQKVVARVKVKSAAGTRVTG